MVIILTVNFFFFLYEDHGCGSRISLPPGFSCLKILLKNRLRPSSPQLKWIHLVTLSARITSYSSFCMSNNSSHSSTKFPCKKCEELHYSTQTDDETNYMYKGDNSLEISIQNLQFLISILKYLLLERQ